MNIYSIKLLKAWPTPPRILDTLPTNQQKWAGQMNQSCSINLHGNKNSICYQTMPMPYANAGRSAGISKVSPRFPRWFLHHHVASSPPPQRPPVMGRCSRWRRAVWCPDPPWDHPGELKTTSWERNKKGWNTAWTIGGWIAWELYWWIYMGRYTDT